jgi:hypothetical protein
MSLAVLEQRRLGQYIHAGSYNHFRRLTDSVAIDPPGGFGHRPQWLFPRPGFVSTPEEAFTKGFCAVNGPITFASNIHKGTALTSLAAMGKRTSACPKSICFILAV